jgi:hypothetical protein
MADDTYTVRRSATMAAPPRAVYEQIVDFHNWPAWSPWEDLDPDVKHVYSGADQGVGAVHEWSGNRKAGQGRMTMTGAESPQRVTIDLVFEKPFRSTSETELTVAPDGEGSLVTWTMTGRKTAMTKVLGVFKSMDSLVGPDFEKGLARLRTVVE